ncbi:MAG: hypothetical protein KAV82_01765 [Phycisphaerae bacterium]|nr:hypothetical protein [Phycisphaerae bacterium]
MRVSSFQWIFTLMILLVGGIPGYAQEPSSPEVLINLNEGIHEYLQGELEKESPTHYLAAIERFSTVLEQEPDNTVARLFRALSYGWIALIERETKLNQRSGRDMLVEVSRLLEDESRREEAEQKLAELDEQREDPSLPASERLIRGAEWVYLYGILDRLDEYEGYPKEALEQERSEANARIQEAADRERANYQHMLGDVQELVKLLESPSAVEALLEMITLTKIARIDEFRALAIKEGNVVGRVRKSPGQLRQAAASNLQRAAEVLEAYREAHPGGADMVRINFFLGVVRFRQAVPRRTRNETPEYFPERLEQAQELMLELTASSETPKQWRSYAELYLGLIQTEQGKHEIEMEKRGTAFAEAHRHLNLAGELDTDIVDGEPVSRSWDVIPEIIANQRKALKRFEEAKLAARFRNDFQLSVYTGANYDTNVVLLGERTDLPRGIPNEDDFGFTLGCALDYIVDMGRFDSRLERWTLGVQGRVRQLWHGHIDEFDEQNYGGSVALQYEVVPERDGFGPLRVSLQYDYDFALLGRDAFVEIQSITPTIRLFSLNRRAITEAYFIYSIRDYREPLTDRRYDRDGVYCRLGFVQSLETVNMTEVYTSLGLEPWGLPGDAALSQDDPDHPNRYLTPFIGAAYEWDSTEGDEFDQKALILMCGAQVPLPYGLLFDTALEFEWQDYSHGSRVDYHRRGRRDFIQRYTVGISRTFVLQGGELGNRYELEMDRVLMTVRGGATWTLDDSNVVDRLGTAIFEYDRVVYGVTFVFTYN